MSQYHLRKITEKGVESNFALGDQYTIIYRDKNKSDFIKIVEAYLKDGVEDSVFAFLQTGFGAIYNLVKKGQAYIVTNSGATFSNLTYKGKSK